MSEQPLGGRLREAREARGLSQSALANTTKISVTAIDALERGDYGRIPGGIYGRAFVRAYASQVGLDPEEALGDYARELEERARDLASRRARPAVTQDDLEFLARQRRAVRVLRVAAVVLVVVVLAVVAWRLSRSETVDPSAGPVAASDVRLPPTPPPAPPPAGPLGPEPAEAPQPLEADQAETPAALRVSVEVSGECWLEITADGTVVLSRLLTAGERHEWTAEQEIVLDAGNAGVVSWTINGQPARPMGAAGEHRRVVVTPLTVDALLAD